MQSPKESLFDKIETILDNLYVGVYVTDGKGYTVYINKVYEEMSKLPRKELLGKNMKELVKRGYFDASATLLVLKTKKSAVTTFTTKTSKKLLSHGKPIFDNYKKIEFVVNTVYDISEFDTYYTYFGEASEESSFSKSEIIAHSPKMTEIIELAIRISNIDSTVLLTGESGVGKEVLARLIHSLSKRKNYPFVKVNCAAIPPNLIEAELFGYEKGAFTGANPKGKKGIFEEANKGTIFLDEIGELPIDVQAKLLQVLQDKEFVRLGSTKPIKVNIRILAATNRNLKKMVEKGTFREDLFYRLNVISIHIPPLRERKEDIEPLTYYMLKKFNQKYHLNKKISKSLISLFKKLSWKGNVRELENYIERLVVLSKNNTITREDYFSLIKENDEEHKLNETDKITNSFDNTKTSCINLKEYLENQEKQLLQKVARECKTIDEFSKKLGISRSTAIRKIKKFHIKIHY